MRPWEPLLSGVICVIDTETTGLEAGIHQIIELAAAVVHLERQSVLGTFTVLAAPSREIPEEDWAIVTRVSKISPVDLLSAWPLPRALARFRSWYAQQGGPPVTSYCRDFDERFCAAAGLMLPWAGCIQRCAGDVFGEYGSRGKGPSLKRARELCALPEAPEAHRALPDALAAAEVLCQLRAGGYRVQHADLSRTPMALGWEDTNALFPTPRGRSAAQQAVTVALDALGASYPLAWGATPPADTLNIVTEDQWYHVYQDRVQAVPFLRESLLRLSGKGPLTGHPRAAIWTKVLEEQCDQA